ncbi:DUF3048 domain-containing protein [Streptomyces sp. NPDC005322]|uniref:DUF3048 N-terminal domain-containing protein n=1 Tax=Streptomyces sp. NPDC005322 TaxID=3157032 RepID=UPI0033BCD327
MAALLAALLGLAAVSGCRQDGAARGPVRSPFTGERTQPAPVPAVKIDNVRPARPRTGIGSADLVYVEQAEGGLSRILAVFSSHPPATVGPVRSARESDLDPLRQFGRPALAYSGVQSALRPAVEGAPLYALPPGMADSAYVRGRGRQAPHNLYLHPEAALGLRWSRPGRSGGTTFTTPDGDRPAFARGPVRVVHAAR